MDASLTWEKDVVVDDGFVGPLGFCATGFIGNQIVTGILNEYIGRVALNVSRSVSLSPIVSQGLIQLESDGIQRYTESVREATGASFVVVGDYEGKRYSHPVPERIAW